MKRILIKIRRWFADRTMKKKLMISYLLLIFVPLAVLTYISYTNVSKEFHNQIIYSANQSFEQANNFIQNKVQSSVYASDMVYINSDVQHILSKNTDAREGDIIQQLNDMNVLEKTIYSIVGPNGIFRMCLYVDDGLVYAKQDINFAGLQELKNTAAFNRLMQSKEKVIWLPPEEVLVQNRTDIDSVKVIPLLRKIWNMDDMRELIGVVKVCLLESDVKNILMKSNITRNGVVFLQNAKGELICSSNDEMLNRLNLQKEAINPTDTQPIQWENMYFGGSQFIVNAQNVQDTDWTLIAVIPYDEILSPGNAIRATMILVMLAIGLVACLIAALISSPMTGKLSVLSEKMNAVEHGDLNVSVQVAGNDEIGHLMRSFNYMVRRIRTLVEEQYKLGEEKKNAELNVLQAQINPHFLYNTLDLINWKAMEYDAFEISDIAQLLAKFYKLSLNKGKNIVSVQDEVDHAKAYVQIQNFRYNDKIKLAVDLSPEAGDCKILRIILQPIVENAILHGILKKEKSVEGTIWISGKIENGNLILTVRDDGVGMTEQQLQKITRFDVTEGNHGYGVYNTDTRIKLRYGQQYGLTYHSVMGEGTTVDIIIPAIPNEKE